MAPARSMLGASSFKESNDGRGTSGGIATRRLNRDGTLRANICKNMNAPPDWSTVRSYEI